MNTLDATVDALARHPLFQLSTAGQELCHTNMLYWLALNRATEAAPVWEALGVDPPTDRGAGAMRGPVTREWKHVDLYVDAGVGRRKLVLENKVLAIATAEQLTDYHQTVLGKTPHTRADPIGDSTSWRLLSLLPLTVDPPKPWQLVRYADLVPALHATAEALDGADAQLVGQYAGLVELLVRLCDDIDIVSDMDQPVLLSAPFTARLREARLLTLVRKLRTARFANLLSARLQTAFAEPLRVHVDMSRSEALCESFFPTGSPGVEFGWQVQEKSVKLAMRTGLPAVSGVEGRNKLAAENHEFFAFDDVPAVDQLLLQVGKKEWNGYTHEFVYRYRNLRPEVTWRQLGVLCEVLTTRAARHAREYPAGPDGAPG